MKLEGFRITDLDSAYDRQGPLTTKIRIISATTSIDIATCDPEVRKWAESLIGRGLAALDEVLTVEISK